jgi:hypothetical protein
LHVKVNSVVQVLCGAKRRHAIISMLAWAFA